MKIIIAEDNVTIALQYQKILEARGHEVTLTKDGKQCMERYIAVCNASENHDAPFDAAILDYRMPEKDGLEAAKEILQLRPVGIRTLIVSDIRLTGIDRSSRYHVGNHNLSNGTGRAPGRTKEPTQTRKNL